MNSETEQLGIAKKQIYSIDLCRYFFAVLVVALHCGLFTDVNPLLGLVTTQAFARTAVPFFLCVSGYFYLKKLVEGKKAFLQYCWRLLITYAIWSIPYYLVSFFSWGYESFRSFLSYMAVSFLLTGSSYHFWFFPAVFFSVAVSTLFFKLNLQKWLIPCSMVIYTIGVLCCAYTRVMQVIPFYKQLCDLSYFSQLRHIVFTGFPYFVSGYVLYLLNKNFSFFRDKSVLLLAVAVTVWMLEFAVVAAARFYSTLAITFGMYPLMICIMNGLLQHPMETVKTKAAKFRILANFTYYAHVLFMDLTTWAATHIFGFSGAGNTPLFFITVLLTSSIGFGIWKSNNRKLLFLVR